MSDKNHSEAERAQSCRDLAGDALARSEHFLQEAQRVAGIGYYVLDILANTWISSDILAQIFGISSDYKKDSEGWLALVHPDDKEMMWTYFTQYVVAERQPFDKEYRIIRANTGETRWVSGLGKLEFDDNNTPIQMLGTIQDITDRRHAQDKLQKAFAEIQDLKEQLEAENILLRHEVENVRGHREIIGKSSAIKNVMAQVQQVAATDSTTLILGETGVGKELIARAIHEISSRKDHPMVTVNCAAIPSALVESELFGREKGAYTGALTKQVGRFEMADGSTILLDEVGELSSEAQAKLLRVLQDGHFERLGSSKTITVDVRIIAATNRALDMAVRDGLFRQDLYYRLNVFAISVPPLRERRKDIPPLVWHFVSELSKRMGKTIEGISKCTMQQLQEYAWPGNVRELRNAVERAMILCKGPTLKIDVPTSILDPAIKSVSLDDAQRQHIVLMLEQTGWRIRGAGGAAEILKVKPSTLESRMAKLNIKRPKNNPR